MTVYVDTMRARFGRMIMCHMIADSDEELLDMARRIGLQARWHQYPGTYRSHFDVSLGKRAAAIAQGAVQIPQMELGRKLIARKSLFPQ